jgi:hypothetical protein
VYVLRKGSKGEGGEAFVTGIAANGTYTVRYVSRPREERGLLVESLWLLRAAPPVVLDNLGSTPHDPAEQAEQAEPEPDDMDNTASDGGTWEWSWRDEVSLLATEVRKERTGTWLIGHAAGHANGSGNLLEMYVPADVGLRPAQLRRLGYDDSADVPVNLFKISVKNDLQVVVHVLNKMLDDKATARLLRNLGSDDGYTPTRNCRLPTVTHCTDQDGPCRLLLQLISNLHGFEVHALHLT